MAGGHQRAAGIKDPSTYAGMLGQVGRSVEVLVSKGEGRKERMTGRARDNRLVHLATVEGVRPGDIVETVVTGAAPHYLLADGPLRSLVAA